MILRRIRFFLLLLSLFLPVSAAAAGQTAPPDGQPVLEKTAEPESADPFLDKDLDTLYEEAEKGAVQVYDPIEPVNRAIFQFNDRMYFWVLKPVATGYRAVMPVEIRTCVKNFFYNLFAPIRIVNCLLQGKGQQAGNEGLRLLINTTAGMAGLADVADRYPELKSHDEDLGQTLAVYGIGNGFYLVIPLIGPSTLRDAAGWGGDVFLNPVTYTVESWEGAIAVFSVRTLNDISFRIGDYETLKAASLDPYAAFRDGYIQFRNSKIRD